jgi:hypothetical protein
MQNGLFTSVSHSRYVIIYDRHAGDDINVSHNGYGTFDVDNNRICGKQLQLNDIRHAASTTTTRNNKWKRRG